MNHGSSCRRISLARLRKILKQPELEPRFLAHAVLCPWWRPYQLDADLADTRYGADRLLDLAGQRAGDRAGRRRQRHLDIDGTVALDDELVDEAEIDEIDRQLGVAHRLQRCENLRFEG